MYAAERVANGNDPERIANWRFDMQHTALLPIRVLATGIALLAGTALADYTIDWHTIDGGGDMWSTGGGFELSGTIGRRVATRSPRRL